MSKAVQRSIEDIGYSARRLAQEAAKRLGMPVADDIDTTMAEPAYKAMRRFPSHRAVALEPVVVDAEAYSPHDAAKPSACTDMVDHDVAESTRSTDIVIVSDEVEHDVAQRHASTSRHHAPAPSTDAPGDDREAFIDGELTKPVQAAPKLDRPSKAWLVRAAVDTIARRQAVLEHEARSLPGVGPTRETASTFKVPLDPPVSPMAQDVIDVVWHDIRTLIDHVHRGSSLDSVDRRMRMLAETIDSHLAAPSSAGLAAGLLARIDALQAALPARGADSAAIDRWLATVNERAGSLRVASDDLQRLQETMDLLSSRVDDALRLPDARAFAALEGQVDALAHRLERSETALSSLEGIDRSLSDLFSQFEKTRHATLDAAESAARIAARETLIEAMERSDPFSRPDPRLDVVTRDIQELKERHDASEQRTRASLAGLHHAVERLIVHLITTPDEPATPSSDPIEGLVPGDAMAQHRSSPASWLDAKGAGYDILIEPGSDPRVARQDADGTEAPLIAVHSFGSADTSASGVPAFIAAARSAAQAAQASFQAKPGPVRALDISLDPVRERAASVLSLIERTRTYVTARRRPMTLSLAGLALLIGAFEAMKVEIRHGDPAAVVQAESTAPITHVAIEPPPPSAATATSVPASETTGSIVPSTGSAMVNAPAAVATENVKPPTDTTPVQPAGSAPATFARSSEAPSHSEGLDEGKPANPFLAEALAGSAGLGEGLRMLALSGNAAAQYEVGMRYVQGRSVARDATMAAGWFEKAAQQGSAPAQYRLGLAYEKGLGRSRDAAQAMAWYGRAADAGNMRAMHNLAVMTAEAALGKPDYAKAAGWFEKAAMLGVRDSQFNLAILYARGLGVERSLVRSHMWFSLAAALGDEDAGKKRDEVAARLDPKSLQDAKAAFGAFHVATAVAAANDVPAPVGGWDAVAVSTHSDTAASKIGARAAQF